MRRIAALLAVGLIGCISPRTQIVARFATDMSQGPTGTLTSMRVRVLSDGEDLPRFDQQFQLGTGESPIVLPSELGIVPRDTNNRRVVVEADAISGETLLFTRRAIATFATGKTLVLDIFLPDRCRFPENNQCEAGFSCGATGCEPIERMELPELGADAGMRDASVPMDSAMACGAGTHDCSGTCVADDDINACGTSCTSCEPPANATAACTGGTCTFACQSGFAEVSGGCVDPTLPRPIFPLSMGYVTSSQPTFRWVNATGAEGARVQICQDPGCATIVSSFDVMSGTSGRPAAAIGTNQRAIFFWRLFSISGGIVDTRAGTTWEVQLPPAAMVAEATRASLHASWPRLFDIDRDGDGEVAVAARDANTVFVYTGTPTVPTASSPTVLMGASGSQFGASIARVGDVDGDGFADFLVGAPGANEAHLFRGSSSGLSSTAIVLSGSASFGAQVSGAGDVDGDGYGDVLVSSPGASVSLFRGSPGGLITTAAAVLTNASTGFGASIAGGGDVNGDGRSDIVIGAPDADRAFVYLGHATSFLDTTAPIMIAGAAGTRFGSSVAISGDVGGPITARERDGYADVVVGAPSARSVFVYVGRPSGPATTADYTLNRPTVTDFGIAVAHVGDIDENVYDDILVGASDNTVYYYLSNDSGIGALGGWNLDIAAPTGATGFGLSLSAAGYSGGRDIFADVMIGAPGSTTAYFFEAGASGLSRPSVTFTGAAGSGFAASVN